jgi:HEAT repeat protein
MALTKRSQAPAPLRTVQPRAHGRDRAGLIAQLQEGDAEARRWAARDLTGEPDIAPVLASRLLLERDDNVRQALFTALAGMGDRSAVQALLPLLRSDDTMLRNTAIDTLAGMPDALRPSIAEQLVDADVDVRILAVQLLARMPVSDGADWAADLAAQVAARDADVNAVAAAIEVLAEIGRPGDVAVLNDAARRFAGHPFIAFAARMAAERIAPS